MVPVDPLKFQKLLWPNINFYKEQREIIYSVRDNEETLVPAGNMLGKDFVTAFIALWFFLTHHPVRVVTTSVDNTQLEGVLWGEIRRFIQTAKTPLDCMRGGPLIINHLHLRKMVKGQVDGLSYMIGRVAAKGEGMLGHHAPYSLFIADEASGVDDISYDRADTWAKRKLIIGNPFPCTNFFYKGVRGGDVKAEDNGHLYRKVIKIKAVDSPNVRLATTQIAAGRKPTYEVLIPGVLSYSDYTQRRALWDNVRQCVSLDAEFYEGSEVLLYPPDWLNRAERIAASLPKNRQAKTLGIDSAQGGDDTSYAICDELGLIHLASMQTPDTAVIAGRTLALMQEYCIEARNVLFDAGGGGKQHADYLRQKGHFVRTIAFGASVSQEPRRGLNTIPQRKRFIEERYVYRNRRAEMYGVLRQKLDPSVNEKGFGIPAEYSELRRQLAPIPLLYDGEGRLELPPKHNKDRNSQKPSMEKLIGRSPDDADALVLAVYGLEPSRAKIVAGAIL
jgi:hypothetical protein